VAEKRFRLGPNTQVSGLDTLINAGPPTPATEPVTPNPTAAGHLAEYERRMIDAFSKRRMINITSVATPQIKARLALISRAAEDATGSRQYTESALIRALVELFLMPDDIDWYSEFSALAKEQPDLVQRPVEALRWILSRRLPQLNNQG